MLKPLPPRDGLFPKLIKNKPKKTLPVCKRDAKLYL
jgi:hypothetical protein